ncbi:MAG: multidrug ABC transporter permease [Candidatus Terraquivivens tikiterensis]|uniref:Multidrug ABC transporter permease n=1 Tax=Candidatus Terraquivivens tikiterensis TaxID=1980982 RepID=A0A2R7Y8A6_9ARCH|nr:MAG: multidrug ABC transporter permease [Candidatus Terraquivivens tikiterensis]
MSEYRPSALRGLLALTGRELKKWAKEPIILLMAILQPIIWMGLLGKAMNINAIFSASSLSNVNVPDISIPEYGITIPGWVIKQKLMDAFNSIGASVMQNVFGVTDYFSYMSVGMISMIVMFTTMFSGMSMVWDRRLGFLDKVLSTPVSRGAIIFSKVLNAALRSMFQATIILALAVAFGLKVSPTFNPLNLFGVYAAIFLLSVGLSSLFLALALRSTRHETQMAVVNLINMPLMFASNVFFPTSMMPEWLRAIASVNPVSYLTDAIRQLTILPLDVSVLVMDFAYLGVFAAVLFAAGITLSWKYLTR